MRGTLGQKQHVIAIIVLLVATVLAVITFITVASSPKEPQASITISGKLVCLPHKDTSGPTTLECAYGLQADDGRYFGLQDYDITNLQISESVEVQGELVLPEENSKYAISGSIVVRKIDSN